MLISDAGAGMAAVFRAQLTGVVFALEMPYKDDLAHEAVLPARLASVFGPCYPRRGFADHRPFLASPAARPLARDTCFGQLCWARSASSSRWSSRSLFAKSAVFAIHAPIPHTRKLVIGGLLTGLCGLLFVVA
jgi:CIC family chloride channel protein